MLRYFTFPLPWLGRPSHPEVNNRSSLIKRAISPQEIRSLLFSRRLEKKPWDRLFLWLTFGLDVQLHFL